MVDRQNQPAAWRRALESRRVAKTCEARHAARVTRACRRRLVKLRERWAVGAMYRLRVQCKPKVLEIAR